MASNGFYGQFQPFSSATHAQAGRQQHGNAHEKRNNYKTPKTMVGLDPRALAEQGIVAISPGFLRHLQQSHQPARSARQHHCGNLYEAHVVQRPRGPKKSGPDMHKALAHVHYHEPADEAVYSRPRIAHHGPTEFPPASNGYRSREPFLMTTVTTPANRCVAHSDAHTSHQRFHGNPAALVAFEPEPPALETQSNTHSVTTGTTSAMALYEPPAMPGLGSLSVFSRNKRGHSFESRLKTLWDNNTPTTQGPANQTLISMPSAYTPNGSNSVLSSPSTATTDWALEAMGEQSPEQMIYELELEEGAHEKNNHNLWFQWTPGPLAGIEVIGNSPSIAIGQSSPTPSSLGFSQMTTHCRAEPTFNPWEDLACSAEVKINSWTLALGGGMLH